MISMYHCTKKENLKNILKQDGAHTKKEQRRELADIGNISMMLYDNT